MTDYPEGASKTGSRRADDTPRRRATDLPQPLDYPTRELVRDIVDYQPSAEPPRKSFFRKLLLRNRG